MTDQCLINVCGLILFSYFALIFAEDAHMVLFEPFGPPCSLALASRASSGQVIYVSQAEGSALLMLIQDGIMP